MGVPQNGQVDAEVLMVSRQFGQGKTSTRDDRLSVSSHTYQDLRFGLDQASMRFRFRV